MGSSKKDKKDKKRKHDQVGDDYTPHKEKKHKKKHKHNKEKKRDKKEKPKEADDSFSLSSESEIIEVPVTAVTSDKYSRPEERDLGTYDRLDPTDYAYDRLERAFDKVYERPEKSYERRDERVTHERDDRYDKYERPEKYYQKDSRSDKYYEKESRPERSSEYDRSYDKYDRTEPPQSSGSADSLSIEETNRLRAKLGLKPLDVGSSSSASSAPPKITSRDSKDSKPLEADLKKVKDDLGEFYHKPAENAAKKLEAEKLRAKFLEHKEKRMLQNKLSKVKGLGDSDGEDDVMNWVDKTRQIEQAKREADKRAKMLEELDAQFGIGEIVESEQKNKRRDQYTQRDIVGLKVDHDVNSFAEERDTILTLKDKGVLDEDEEDVLMNVNMLENEKYKKNVEVKKKKIHYNAYEDPEYDEFGNPKEKSLLSQYDEEIDGEKRDGFRIGFDNGVERKKAVERTVKEKLAQKTLETIAEKNLKPMSEYYDEEELAKFKKPKKKIRRIRAKGKLTAEEIMQPQNTGIESIGSRRTKIKTAPDEPEMSIDDIPDVKIPMNLKLEDDRDDLLERALHNTRRVRQRNELIDDIIKTEVKNEPQEEADSGNIILNATAEFCRTLGDIPTYGKAGNREEDEDDLIDMEKAYQDDMKDSDEDCEIIEPSGWNSVNPYHEGGDPSKSGHQEIPILEEEPDVSTGMAAALKLAMSKGYLDKEEKNRPSNSRLAYLQAQHYSIEDKNYGEEGGERGGRGRNDHRFSGPIQDFKEKDSFKPNVKLEYIDDDGHLLNAKEAFRYLSHKFHGKGPGKNKVEKRLKKSIQETLMMKMSSTDTPLGTLNMLQAKQRETQSPFVVLSGNKQPTVISKPRR